MCCVITKKTVRNSRILLKCRFSKYKWYRILGEKKKRTKCQELKDNVCQNIQDTPAKSVIHCRSGVSLDAQILHIKYEPHMTVCN